MGGEEKALKGSQFFEITEQNIEIGEYIIAYKERQKRTIGYDPDRLIDLSLKDKIKGPWVPIVLNGSFCVVKGISCNGKIPVIKNGDGLTFLTRNQMLDTGIDRYGGKTVGDVTYSEIIDTFTKERAIQTCLLANRLAI